LSGCGGWSILIGRVTPFATPRRAAPLAATALLLFIATSAAPTERVAALTQARAEIASDLARPIAECLARQDTTHAAFRGCIDWHSAVHATWALASYTRLTQDRRYVPLLRRVVTPGAIAAERELLARDPSFAMPYGRAWFLRLAIDHERLFGDGALAPMAGEVAASLVQRYARRAPDPRAGSYDSASWALINLLDWARHTGDAALAQRVRDLARAPFVEAGTRCPLELETRGFLSPCVTWAWLVSRVLGPADFVPWFRAWDPGLARLAPIAAPGSAHQYGMNFSRAWGLWELAALLPDDGLADAYAAHFTTTFRQPQHWRGDYRTVGHWVAQFGMFAAAPLFGPDAR